jgi:ribulose-phosphate 3-epimerase
VLEIAPSLMCADCLHLQRDIEALDRAGTKLFHIDIMDGHFVPNLAMNLETVRKIKGITKTAIDVHLMVDRPDSYFSALAQLQVEYVSFHIEASTHPIRLLRMLKSRGAKAGIALNPGTPVENLSMVLDEVDFVLLMTVEPGFAGQTFIPRTLDKIGVLSELIKQRGLEIAIEVDGNISVETGKLCIARGASILVAGTSSIFDGKTELYSAFLNFKHQLGPCLDKI